MENLSVLIPIAIIIGSFYLNKIPAFYKFKEKYKLVFGFLIGVMMGYLLKGSLEKGQNNIIFFLVVFTGLMIYQEYVKNERKEKGE